MKTKIPPRDVRELDMMDKSKQVGDVFEWDQWRENIPFINFKAHWEVKIIPPYKGAIVRFHVRAKTQPDRKVSILLDGYNLLGGAPSNPYWEICDLSNSALPFARVNIDETDELIGIIHQMLNGTYSEE